MMVLVIGLFYVIELSIVCLNTAYEGHKTETLSIKTVFDTFASIGSVRLYLRF